MSFTVGTTNGSSHIGDDDTDHEGVAADATEDTGGIDDDTQTQSSILAKGQTKDENGYYYRLSGDGVLRVWGGGGDNTVELDREGGGDGTYHDDGSVSHELNDGTLISIAADGTVSWRNTDGTGGTDDSAVGAGTAEPERKLDGGVDFVDGGYVDFDPGNGGTDTIEEPENDDAGDARTDHDRAEPIAAGGTPEGRYLEFADGSRLDIESDGDVTVTGAAGDFTRVDGLSGERTSGRVLEDGTTFWRNENGDWGSERDDGTAVRIDADGDRFVRDGRGDVHWRTADGLSGTLSPGASVELSPVPELSDPEFFEGVSEDAARLRGGGANPVPGFGTPADAGARESGVDVPVWTDEAGDAYLPLP